MLPRWSRWFELHKLEDVAKTWVAGKDVEAAENSARATYIEWMREQTQPVYLREPRAEIPNAEVFPWHQLVQMFPRAYFTNTVSWLSAFAIATMLDPETGRARPGSELAIYGVDMALDSEYGTQRPSCEYWIGLAEGLGVRVTIPESSDLTKCSYLYGVQDEPPFRRKMALKRRELLERKQQMEAEVKRLERGITGMAAASEMLEYAGRNWGY